MANTSFRIEDAYLDICRDLITENAEEIISLYKEWLERMTGLTFSFEDAKKEFVSEMECGNDCLVKNRIEDIHLLKSNKFCSTRENILLNMQEYEM